MSNNIFFSSEKQDWRTPIEFYNKYDEIYNFVLDAACESTNSLCNEGFYFDKGFNSLDETWVRDGYVWCNPPYGRELKKFIKKAYEESLKGAKIVMLIPSRTDTIVWHDYIFGKAKVEFIKGRLKFSNSKNPAPFPSAIIIFN